MLPQYCICTPWNKNASVIKERLPNPLISKLSWFLLTKGCAPPSNIPSLIKIFFSKIYCMTQSRTFVAYLFATRRRKWWERFRPLRSWSTASTFLRLIFFLGSRSFCFHWFITETTFFPHICKSLVQKPQNLYLLTPQTFSRPCAFSHYL